MKPEQCTYCNILVEPMYDHITIGTFVCPDCRMPLEVVDEESGIPWKKISEQEPPEEEALHLIYLDNGKDAFDSYKISRWKKRDGIWCFAWPRVTYWAYMTKPED